MATPPTRHSRRADARTTIRNSGSGARSSVEFSTPCVESPWFHPLLFKRPVPLSWVAGTGLSRAPGVRPLELYYGSSLRWTALPRSPGGYWAVRTVPQT